MRRVPDLFGRLVGPARPAVGLLGGLAGAAPQLLVHGDRLFAEYRGALVENYVAQQLAAAAGDLHYWRSSGGKAEVDFLLERSGEVCRWR